MTFWEHPEARILAPLDGIVARAEHIHGAEPRSLTMDVQDFVSWAVQVGRYPRDALPHDAMVSAAVDFYICTVENGGHTAFVGNGCWDEALRDDVEEGLHRLGFDALAAIFSELEAFACGEPERFEAISWRDPVVQDLDDRFNALPRQDYFERHADWIRSWPNLRIVPSAQYREILAALAERNGEKRRWWL